MTLKPDQLVAVLSKVLGTSKLCSEGAGDFHTHQWRNSLSDFGFCKETMALLVNFMQTYLFPVKIAALLETLRNSELLRRHCQLGIKDL